MSAAPSVTIEATSAAAASNPQKAGNAWAREGAKWSMFALCSLAALTAVSLLANPEPTHGAESSPIQEVSVALAEPLVPLLAPSTVEAAGARTGLTMNPVDLSVELDDRVNSGQANTNHAGPATSETSSRIVAQCDQPEGTVLTVGVVPEDLYLANSYGDNASRIFNNSLAELLDCP